MIRTVAGSQFASEFCLRPQQFAWFLGAGASASAGVPTGYAMIKDFRKQLFCQLSGVSKRVSESELKIITEMTTGRYSMRSISGLSKDTGFEKDIVNTSISSLLEKGLIEQGVNSRGEIRWYPSPSGRVVATRANKTATEIAT